LELERHVAVLLPADAVLARERTGGLHAGREDLEACRLRPFELVRTEARIEQDQRMKVAVSCVKYVRDPKPMSHPCLHDEPEDVGQARARDDAVLHVIVGGQATHRREGALAACPEPLAFQGAARDTNLACRMLAADRLDPDTRVVEPVARTVDLEKKDAAGV